MTMIVGPSEAARCPDCGLTLSEHRDHRCGVPLLTHAAGVDLTPAEQRYIRWLAGWDHETVDVFASLFRRIRDDEQSALTGVDQD